MGDSGRSSFRSVWDSKNILIDDDDDDGEVELNSDTSSERSFCIDSENDIDIGIEVDLMRDNCAQPTNVRKKDNCAKPTNFRIQDNCAEPTVRMKDNDAEPTDIEIKCNRAESGEVGNMDMCKALAEMYINKSDLNDAEISINDLNGGDIIFSVHKLVLAMWSRYFAKAFFGQNKIEKRVVLTDVDPKVLEWVLSFMYNVFKPIETSRNALEIYKVAENFQVKYIMEMMVNFVYFLTVTIDNVLDILEATIYMNLHDKKEKCLKFVQEHTYKIFDANYYNISPTAVKEILNLDTLCFESEYELIKQIFRWGKMQSKRNMLDSYRDALEEFLPNLYFLSLSHDDFTRILVDYEDFFLGDEVTSIFMNISIFKSKTLPYWLTAKKRNFKFDS